MIISRLKSVCYSIQTGGLILKSFRIGREQLILATNYMRGQLFPEHTDEKHLEAVMQWLCLAQDVCHGRGTSAVYDLKKGWGGAYPETSGYIIATYLAYADFTGDENYIRRAIEIGDWEIDIQTPGGGILSSLEVSYTRVFNTGQVILGWCVLYERTNNDKYLKAALRAGEYLLNLQETDGSWKKDTYCGARTYHSRIDWALLRLALLSGEQRFAETAYKNLKWVLSQQKENGWFDNCGFNNDNPITHVLEYTLKGLLECHIMNVPEIGQLNILPLVIKTADALCAAIPKYSVKGVSGMVPTSFDRNWQSTDWHSCLTGNAQLASFFFRLAYTTNSDNYTKIAELILQATKRTQTVETTFAPIRGAIAGTYPLYHGYVANGYPNWAAKFFADALLMKIQYGKKIAILA
jgi:hypothetical protein